MHLKIVTVGEPVLRARSQELSKQQILSPSIQDLIGYMRETVRDAPGVGLAAPQVGESLRLAVIEDKAEYHKGFTESQLKERERTEIPFHVIVNPVIESSGSSISTFFEGCLSLPGFTSLVSRTTSIQVRYMDHQGEPRVIEASGWYARILRHEIDHLDGTLYIDRMHAHTFSSLENYTRHWKDRDPRSLITPV